MIGKLSQETFWDNELAAFDAIYTRKKSKTGVFLDRLLRNDMYERFEFTLKHAAPVEDRTFLDVGCGTGLYAQRLAEHRAAKVTGIDISARMIEFCQARACDAELTDRCSFVQSDLLQYECVDPVDVCIGIGLFDYIQDPLPVVSKMREVTRDKAIMSFPRRWVWRAPVRRVRLALKRCEVFFYTRSQIARMMTEAGFVKCDIEQVGNLYCVVAHARR